MVIRLPGEEADIDDQYVQLTGRARGNRLIQSVVEMFLQDLRFDDETGLATEYRPMTADGASIVLDPHRRFGEPIVEPGGYAAETLWHATNTEGGIDEAAGVYGVTAAEVRIANHYYDMLIPGRVA